MARPIQLIRGGERQTVYNNNKAGLLEKDGWVRVSSLTPEQQADMLNRPVAPWAGYDDMTIEEVLKRAYRIDGADIDTILAYEHATKNRKGIMTGLREPIAPLTIETVVEEPLMTTETVEIVDAPAPNRGPLTASAPPIP